MTRTSELFQIEEFKGKIESLPENTGKYIPFSVPIEKEIKPKTIPYKLKFIDSIVF